MSTISLDSSAKQDPQNGFADISTDLRTGWSWPVPFTAEFSAGRFTGLRENIQFSRETADLIVGLSEDGATWWVENCIRLSGNKKVEAGTVIDLQSMNYQMYSPFKVTQVTAPLEAAAARFGLVPLDSDNKQSEFRFRVTDPKLLALADTTQFIQPPVSALNITPIPTVDIQDPSVRVSQVATMTQHTTASVAEWESHDDATQVKERVLAYNTFIESPTVENLVEATKNPAKRDAYFLAMKYLSQNQVAPELISVIHMAFDIQLTVFGHYRSQEPFQNLSNRDKLVLRQLIDRLPI